MLVERSVSRNPSLSYPWRLDPNPNQVLDQRDRKEAKEEEGEGKEGGEEEEEEEGGEEEKGRGPVQSLEEESPNPGQSPNGEEGEVEGEEGVEDQEAGVERRAQASLQFAS